ncbi:hypothetical protein ADEAN_000427100 [Angomonas deanei]|uniref:Uncharacterized protein n=1 Tax=Angomonas deanei TaxID=59799 RepID=A0A7G2CDL8_9TRYP|nr:hypothetical protein ADEAN_000427100 [Angomonas deanei]
MTVGEVLTPYDETVPPSLPALFATATIRVEVQWNTKRPSVDQPIKVKRALQRDLSRLLLTAVDWIEIREGSLSSCTVPFGGKHCDAFVFEFYPYLSSRLSGDLFVGHGLYLLHDAYRAALSPSTKADFVFLLEALGSDVAGNSFRVVHVNVTKAHP